MTSKITIQVLINNTSTSVQTFQLEQGGVLVFGRKGSNASVEINDPAISRRHAQLLFNDEGLFIEDLESTNKTWINGKSIIPHVPLQVSNDQVISFNPGNNISIRVTFEMPINSPEKQKVTDHKTNYTLNDWLKEKNSVLIGRSAEKADIILEDKDKFVSREHAMVFKEGDAVYVEDLGSTNGTYINGKRIFSRTRIFEDQTLYIGLYTFRLNETIRDLSEEPAIQAIGLEKYYNKDKKTGDPIGLHTIDIKIPKQEFVALMGPSGCGKSTLLKALNGDNPATAGKVLIHGLDLMKDYQYLKRKIGYVPQDDIVHKDLEVEKSLYYASKLRLGDDVTDEFIAKKIDEVLTNLNINRSDIRQKKIGELSGGQRKRVSIAVELLNNPTILFLDEPTSPLDPETIEEFLKCIKNLTKLGTTVIMVTHKPEDLNYVDKVIFLTTKGYHAYYGEKGKMLFEHFSANDIISIYALLSKDEQVKQWYARWRGEHPCSQSSPSQHAAVPGRINDESVFRQLYWLCVRYLNIKLNDRINTFLLLIQPVIIAGLIAFIFKDMHIGILFLMSITAIWFGVSNAAKEIVSETPIYKRERMFNLHILTYIFSKIIILTLFGAVQVLMFVGIIYLRYKGDTPEGLDTPLMLGYYWSNAGFMLYLSFSATLMGLLLSALFNNAEKVMTIVPIILIPQIMLAGVVTRIEDKVTETLSYATLGRWGTEGFAILQDTYYWDKKDSCTGSIVAMIPEFKTDTIRNDSTMVTMICQKPVNEMKITKKPALDMLDLYNDKLMGIFKSKTIQNTFFMITVINVIIFLGLYFAIKRKDSI